MNPPASYKISSEYPAGNRFFTASSKTRYAHPDADRLMAVYRKSHPRSLE